MHTKDGQPATGSPNNAVLITITTISKKARIQNKTPMTAAKVAGAVENRKGEPILRSFFARMFYRLMRKISSTEIVDGARDYRLMTRQVADAILSMKEYNRFTKGIYGWVGFQTKCKKGPKYGFALSGDPSCSH